MIDVLLRDLRYALRMTLSRPGFTAVAVLSLALGIGANTAIFTLIDAVMLRSLPVRSPEQLVTLGDASRPTAIRVGAPMANVFSYPLYQRLRDQDRLFDGILASGKAGRTDVLVGNGSAEEAHSRLVSGNYFDVLGVSPILGRPFSPEEDRSAGTSPVVVISYSYWVSRFGRDPNVLGTTLRINASPFTVIGVAPPHFEGEVVGSPTDIWIPASMQPQINPGDPRLDKRDANWLLCIGRLRPGVSIQNARAEITTLVQQALVEYEGAAHSPDKLRDIRSETVKVEPGGKGFSWIRKHDSPLLFTLMAMVGLVLLIACANVANLLLARGTSRQKEVSVRLALGASRGRLVRQLLTESVLLACTAGAAGLLLASWGSRVLARLASGASGQNPIPFEVDVHPNGAVLAFTAAVCIFTAVLFGLIPALRSTRVDLAPALKENASSVVQSRWRLGKLLVVAQLALSVVLLIAAGLFVRSIAYLNSLDVGYSRRNLVLLSADFAGSGYAPATRFTVARRLLEDLESVPGIAGVTVSDNGIFSGADSNTESLKVEGFVPVRKGDSASSFDQVGPRYFHVLGVPILEGRDFDEHDKEGARSVAIINDTMARFYFGRTNPLGKYLVNGSDRYAIIGVAKDLKERDLKSKTERRFYVPLFQSTDVVGTFNFEIKTREDAAHLTTAVRHKIQSFDRNLRVSSIEPVSVLIDQSIGGDKLIATLSGFFGILVLVLAANGLYGVISYTTSRRANEIGVRMAIGADRAAVISMLLRETLLLMAAGIGIGLPIALGVTRLIAASLAGISTADPTTLGVVTAGMLIVGILAGFVPAARASRIDPMAALRQE